MTIESFLDKFNFITIGKIVIHGHQGVKWGIRIQTKKYGYICFRLPLPCFYANKPYFPELYYYISPNGTTWAATFGIGGNQRQKEHLSKAPLRRLYLGGHNFDIYDKWVKRRLKAINDFYPYISRYEQWEEQEDFS